MIDLATKGKKPDSGSGRALRQLLGFLVYTEIAEPVVAPLDQGFRFQAVQRFEVFSENLRDSWRLLRD